MSCIAQALINLEAENRLRNGGDEEFGGENS
jgi:hypothetical protein